MLNSTKLRNTANIINFIAYQWNLKLSCSYFIKWSGILCPLPFFGFQHHLNSNVPIKTKLSQQHTHIHVQETWRERQRERKREREKKWERGTIWKIKHMITFAYSNICFSRALIQVVSFANFLHFTGNHSTQTTSSKWTYWPLLLKNFPIWWDIDKKLENLCYTMNITISCSFMLSNAH